MVDFSCALSCRCRWPCCPPCVSAAATISRSRGGKYLEVLANADTIVFDKTGTLTHATPTVVQVVPFGTRTEDEVLQIAACLEEHYPPLMANAVVQAAAAKGIRHDEMHSEVQYVVAHGIASQIGGEKAVIGSQHFVFEDEGCYISDERVRQIRRAAAGIFPLPVSGHRRCAGRCHLYRRPAARGSL